MDIKDKDTRMALVAKYLEAETTVDEETLLAAYYAANEPEEERHIALMIRMEHTNESLFSKERAEEFDRIVNQTKSKQPKPYVRRMVWWGISAAATIALLLLFNVSLPREAEPSESITTVEIAGYVQQLMNMEDVETISASPVKNCVLVTATLTDGTTKMFIMNKDAEAGSTSMLAIN